MAAFKSLTLIVFLSFFLGACSNEEAATSADAGMATDMADDHADSHETHAPSSGAEGMAGAMGTIEYKPTDWKEGEKTFWKDSDGIAPGVAGCHVGADENGVENGRMFGEACLDNGLLVESNPGVEELHSHDNDLGHPDTFDCNAWCVGQGKTAGVCEVSDSPPCAQSAICACS